MKVSKTIKNKILHVKAQSRRNKYVQNSVNSCRTKIERICDTRCKDEKKKINRRKSDETK